MTHEKTVRKLYMFVSIFIDIAFDKFPIFAFGTVISIVERKLLKEKVRILF